MANLRRAIALGNTPATRFARAAYYAVMRFHLPVPRALGVPLLLAFRAARTAYYYGYRLLVCEPLFKAACRSYGRNVSTGVFVHFVLGDGDIVIGDDTTLDGKSSFLFGSRVAERPRLTIGSRTYVGHQTTFSVSRAVTVGSDCFVAAGCQFLDSPGHPVDPSLRLAHRPPDPDQVKPITVGDNVWIGTDAMLMPGVTVGEGSVIAARAIVTSDVPPYTLVGGMPARVLRQLDPVRPPMAPAPTGVSG